MKSKALTKGSAGKLRDILNFSVDKKNYYILIFFLDKQQYVVLKKFRQFSWGSLRPLLTIRSSILSD